MENIFRQKLLDLLFDTQYSAYKDFLSNSEHKAAHERANTLFHEIKEALPEDKRYLASEYDEATGEDGANKEIYFYLLGMQHAPKLRQAVNEIFPNPSFLFPQNSIGKIENDAVPTQGGAQNGI